MSDSDLLEEVLCQLRSHLCFIYSRFNDNEIDALASELIASMRLDADCHRAPPGRNLWDQGDIALITYADSIQQQGKSHLHSLLDFLDQELREQLSIIHLLPFFPWSSDDGFAVMNYAQVNDAHGSWDDIRHIAGHYKLMSDLVINHCSSRSLWFDNFIKGESPGKDYFYTASPEDDLREVVRPRTNDLLREVQTAEGVKYVWCTFSEDQVDLNFENPQVLIEFCKIIRLYLDHGITIFRLDAIAFLWKEVGTNCLNLPQTHEMVRLLRLLIEHANPDAIIITETNIPNRENLSYFGNNNEAHWIYNFSLPPLLLHSLLTGNTKYLKNWLMSMPPAQNGTSFFNFIASHDGIGLRPVEGILTDPEIEAMTDCMESFGGKISLRALDGDVRKPYEINISLYDALKGTIEKGEDQLQLQRFVCAHAVMLALEGVPAFYIHSLLGTRNDYQRLENTRHNRHINRHQWEMEKLQQALADTSSHHRQVLDRLKALIDLRSKQPAFHPNATQFTLHCGDAIFAFWRQSMDRSQSIFVFNNMSDQDQEIQLSDVNLIGTDQWCDLISGQVYSDHHQTVIMAPYQHIWLSNKF